MLETLPHLLSQNGEQQWQLEDFAGIDQLHLGGMPATLELLNWLPSSAKIGLDIGCGLGGTSRLLSRHHDCNMVGLDLNAQYIKAATLLNSALTPTPKCHFVVANSLALPFPENSFDFVISQHACMNIAQKEELLKGLYKVVKPQGCVLMHEVMLQPIAKATSVAYPTPWALDASESHLCDWEKFKALALAVGFTVEHFEDNTEHALSWIHQTRKQKMKPPFTPPLALGPQAALMSSNVLGNIESGYLRIVSTALHKP